MSTHKSMRRIAVVAPAFIGLLAAMLLGPELALAQEDCQAKLLKAEDEYANTRFNAAIALLTECLDKNAFANPDQQRAAYRLLVLSHLGKGDNEQARRAMNKWLDLIPDYKPDQDQDPPDYIQVFESVTRERESGTPAVQKPPKKKGTKWLLIGGGVVVAGVGAIVALSGDGPPDIKPATPLPTPPDLP